MYKQILTMAALLSMSQVAIADNSEIFKCIDSRSLEIQEECVADTLSKNSPNNDFYAQIAEKKYESNIDAFATITYYPKLNLIEVVSLEETEDVTLIASR